MWNERKNTSLTWLTFFSSSTTLLCCTIPVIFVALGFGSALTVLTLQLHWWIILAEHKFWLFLISALLLFLTYWSLKRTQNNCPLDPELANRCKQMVKWNFRIFFVSLAIWLVGFFSAYLAVPLAYILGIFK